MSRLQDYELRGLPQQAIDLLDDIRELVNNSKYQSSVATIGVPGWTANTGEFAFFSSGSDRRLYLRSATAWQLVAGYNPTLNPSANGTVNAGTGNVFAIIDHIHPSDAPTFGTPVAIDTANNAGSGTDSARSNHQHLGYLQAASMQTFTASGTWTRPSGVSRVFARVWGGGGGGGEAGGVANGANGISGGISSFAGADTVQGGAGENGVGGDTVGGGGAGGAGGGASGGTLNVTGQAGEADTSLNLGGNGGQGALGGGGGSKGLLEVGKPGAIPGGGGGGGGTNAAAGGGGGGGGSGYSEGFTSVTGNVTVTVGTGGAGGTGASGSDGGAGADGRVVVYW